MRRYRLLVLLAFAGLVPWSAGRGQTLEERGAALERQVAELRVRAGLASAAPGDLPTELAGNIHVRWGFPGGRCTILVKEFYVACHDPERKVPEWVTYRLTREDLALDVIERTDDFRPDPDLAPGERAELVDYRSSGYDRGHLAPAADFKRSREAMSSTFLLSNMAPQRPNLNRGIWARLEDQVRQLVQSHGRVWVFTGALYLDARDRPLQLPRLVHRSYSIAFVKHSGEALQSPEQRAPMSIGLPDTSSFIGSGIHLKWERRRSRHFSRGSRQIEASARQRRIRRSVRFCFCTATSCTSRSVQ